MAGYDIGVSIATSSGAQGGQIGDFIVGGSGGVSKTPTWIWLAAAAIAVIALFAFLLRK
jgi:hypothetical protein